MSEVPSLQHIAQVHLVTQLDDHLDLYEHIAEGDLRTIITRTLDTVQSQFYLVPKQQVAEDGALVPREAPVDSVEESISTLWINVSN